MTSMSSSHGFTLAELLIVVVLVIILAAIALPNLLRSQIAANETAAIESLASAIVALYARMPWLERLRTERHAVRALDIGIAMRENAIRQLIRRALGRSPSAKKVRIVESMLDTAVVNHLLDFGMDQDEAASTLASIVNAWLEGGRS